MSARGWRRVGRGSARAGGGLWLGRGRAAWAAWSRAQGSTSRVAGLSARLGR
jgi:hypothetical protein